MAFARRPSIAVMPFANVGGEREQEYFADGITEDIITALARFRWFFVIARNSSFIYKDKPIETINCAEMRNCGTVTLQQFMQTLVLYRSVENR